MKNTKALFQQKFSSCIDNRIDSVRIGAYLFKKRVQVVPKQIETTSESSGFLNY